MPKTNINTILKHGSDTRVQTVDYSSGTKVTELRELRTKSDAVLKNKDVSVERLKSFVIKK